MSASAPNTSTATCSSRKREPTSTCTTKNVGKHTANVAKNKNGSLTAADTACAGPEYAPATRPKKPDSAMIVRTAYRSLLPSATASTTSSKNCSRSLSSAFRKAE